MSDINLRTGAVQCMRRKPKHRSESEHLHIVWCNFRDAFETAEELQAWYRMRGVDRMLVTALENSVYRMWKYGIPQRRIADRKGVPLETVSQIIDRRLKHDGR